MENLASDVSIYINNEIRLLEIKAENDVILKRVTSKAIGIENQPLKTKRKRRS